MPRSLRASGSIIPDYAWMYVMLTAKYWDVLTSCSEVFLECNACLHQKQNASTGAHVEATCGGRRVLPNGGSGSKAKMSVV